jgi:hypothetical protein
MLTERERAIKEKLWRDILKMIPFVIEDGKNSNWSPSEINRTVDKMLDRVNQLKLELKNDDDERAKNN